MVDNLRSVCQLCNEKIILELVEIRLNAVRRKKIVMQNKVQPQHLKKKNCFNFFYLFCVRRRQLFRAEKLILIVIFYKSINTENVHVSVCVQTPDACACVLLEALFQFIFCIWKFLLSHFLQQFGTLNSLKVMAPPPLPSPPSILEMPQNFAKYIFVGSYPQGELRNFKFEGESHDALLERSFIDRFC